MFTYTLALSGWGDSAVDANDVHDNTLGETGPQQTAASTKRIGDEDEEDSNGGELDDTVDASGKQRRVSASQTETLENLGCVVVLCVSN